MPALAEIVGDYIGFLPQKWISINVTVYSLPPSIFQDLHEESHFYIEADDIVLE
jgi:hypothetical protein